MCLSIHCEAIIVFFWNREIAFPFHIRSYRTVLITYICSPNIFGNVVRTEYFCCDIRFVDVIGKYICKVVLLYCEACHFYFSTSETCYFVVSSDRISIVYFQFHSQIQVGNVQQNNQYSRCDRVQATNICPTVFCYLASH